MNTHFFSKPAKTIPLIIAIGIISGMVGNLISNQYLSTDLFTDNGKKIQEQEKITERVYVEESQSINAIKKVSPAVISIVATQDLKIYYDTPFPFYSPFNENDPFNVFPGFQFPAPNQSQPKLNPGQEGKDYEIQEAKVSGGSGFIITSEGLIMTNRHVVSQQNVDYTIITNDGTEYEGEIVSIDPLNDLAILQMVKKGDLKKKKEERTKLTNLPTVKLGDSDNLEVGQKILAIGYALGQYQNTVTSGIISGKGREITASGAMQNPERLSGLLQTDAAINPGNSGGPLINLNGEVIGVNVAMDSSGNGIGFAIPVNDVKSAFESIKKYGRIIRPTLGVRHIILTKENLKKLKIDVDHGALLIGDESKEEYAVIPGSPADKAGLKIKDIILAVDDKDITLNYTLQDAIRNHQPGDEITLKIWRNGDIKTTKVKLAETKEEKRN